MQESKRRRVLVTGGCGFVGAAVAGAFADAGHDVTAVSRHCRPFRDDITFVNLDITRRAEFTDLCRGIDSIVHSASIVQTNNAGRAAVWEVNHGGTESVLAACRQHGIPKLVHVSSASVVYGGRDIENGDESLPYARAALTAYADSKIVAEKSVLAFARLGNTRACALRPHLVFGPGDNRFIPNILARAGRGGIREVGRRDKLTDFTYITNVVDAVLAAERALDTASPVCGQAYFITNDEPVPFFDVVERLLKGLDQPPLRGKVPFWLAYAGAVEALRSLAPKQPGSEDGISRFTVRYLATHHYFSIEKARRDFGWTPRVPLEEGIARTVAGFHTGAGPK